METWILYYPAAEAAVLVACFRLVTLVGMALRAAVTAVLHGYVSGSVHGDVFWHTALKCN